MSDRPPIPPEQEGLMRAIVAAPEDDAPRLIYADWLEEHGDAEQADFIRASLELHGLAANDPRRNALADQVKATAEARGREWLSAVGIASADELEPTFSRGCVEGLEFQSMEPFLPQAERLFWLFPLNDLYFWWQYSWGLNVESLTRLGDMPELLRIRTLRLANYDTAVPHEGWWIFFRSPNLAGLRYLGIHACEFSDRNAELLAAAPALAELTGLSLTQNPVGIEGIRAILRSPYLTNLNRLGLAGTLDDSDVDPDELEALEEVLAERFPGRTPLQEWLEE